MNHEIGGSIKIGVIIVQHNILIDGNSNYAITEVVKLIKELYDVKFPYNIT
jgi:hypothetical protein